MKNITREQKLQQIIESEKMLSEIQDVDVLLERILTEARSIVHADAGSIYVVDGSTVLDDNDKDIIELIKDKNVIVLINKIDLDIVTTPEIVKELLDKPVIEISAKEESGIEQLEDKLKDMFFGGHLSFNDEIYITNARHKAAIANAVESLKLVLNSIDSGMPEDFYSIDLMNCYDELGSLIGEATGEDLIDTIFSDFCMGK